MLELDVVLLTLLVWFAGVGVVVYRAKRRREAAQYLRRQQESTWI